MGFGAGAFKVEAVAVPIRKYYIIFANIMIKIPVTKSKKETGLLARTRAFIL